MSEIQLRLGDCLGILPTLPENSVDAIITDLPYGTTACAWDTVIPFGPMWEQVKRLLKPCGVFVTTASQPFTSALVMSNLAWFKYEWIWEKNRGSNFATVKFMPMKEHENILVFSEGMAVYNPISIPRAVGGKNRADYPVKPSNTGKRQVYSGMKADKAQQINRDARCPRSILKFNTEVGFHPTQKPIALYSYLIRTYTNADGEVLDFCMGSGTTGIACIQTDRNFIGIEINPDYFAIAKKRIEEAQLQMRMPGL